MTELPYSLRLTQTSKGVWYVERLEVNELMPLDCVAKAESFAFETNEMLKRINSA